TTAGLRGRSPRSDAPDRWRLVIGYPSDRSLRSDVGVAFGLVADEGDPAVFDDGDVRVDLGLVDLLAAQGDGALIQPLDSAGGLQLLELGGDLGGGLAVFRFEPGEIGLRQEGRGAAEGQDEVGHDAALDQAFARLIDRVEDLEQPAGLAGR